VLSLLVHKTVVPTETVRGDGLYGCAVAGFYAPLTIEIEDILDWPNAKGSKLIMDITVNTINIAQTEIMLSL